MEIALSRSCGPDDVLTPFGYEEDDRYRETFDNYQTPCNYEDLDVEEHSRAAVVRQAITPRIFDKYFKFAIIRDPIDYTISRYYWDMRSKLPEGTAPSIDQWVRNDSRKIWHNWRLHSIGNEPQMDFYILYDHLHEDASRVSEILGLDYDLGQELQNIRTKTTWRKKQNPIEQNDTYNFIRSKAKREIDLIRRVREERGYG